MTKEALIEDLQLIQHRARVDKDTFVSETIATVIETIEEPPCEDCVSREAVKKQFEEVVRNNGSATELLVRLWKLPPVQPTRPTGKWIEKEDYNLDTYYECSECGEDYCIEGDILIHKYCPNCGARMEVEE